MRIKLLVLLIVCLFFGVWLHQHRTTQRPWLLLHQNNTYWRFLDHGALIQTELVKH